MNLKLITSVFLALWLLSCSVPKSDLEPDDSSVRNTQNGLMIKLINGWEYNTDLFLTVNSDGKKQKFLIIGKALKSHLILELIVLKEAH